MVFVPTDIEVSRQEPVPAARVITQLLVPSLTVTVPVGVPVEVTVTLTE